MVYDMYKSSRINYILEQKNDNYSSLKSIEKSLKNERLALNFSLKIDLMLNYFIGVPYCIR